MLLIVEKFGGFGGGVVEIGFLMEVFGCGLVFEFYVVMVVFGVVLIE